VGALDQLLGRPDPDPNRRGDQWERIVERYLGHDPIYARELRRVWRWADWPGRWGGDAGIDLVAEDNEGRLWAVQAKAYDPAYSVTKADVDTFLAESSRPDFGFRLLIATTDRVGRTARRTIEAQDEPVSPARRCCRSSTATRLRVRPCSRPTSWLPPR
jgi:predicted helicase